MWTCDVLDMWADRQTNKQTLWSQYFTPVLNADWVPGGRRPSDQANRLGLWGSLLAAGVHTHRCHLLLLLSPQAQFTVPLRTGGWYMSVWMLQSTVYGMGFAFALIVAKKRKMLGDPGTVQPGLCRVFIWITGFLSIAGLVVSMIQQCTVWECDSAVYCLVEHSLNVKALG